jgi:hypothetical protein
MYAVDWQRKTKCISQHERAEKKVGFWYYIAGDVNELT